MRSPKVRANLLASSLMPVNVWTPWGTPPPLSCSCLSRVNSWEDNNSWGWELSSSFLSYWSQGACVRISPGCLRSLFLSHHRQMRQKNATIGKFANHRNSAVTKTYKSQNNCKRKMCAPQWKCTRPLGGASSLERWVKLANVRRGEQKGTLALTLVSNTWLQSFTIF